MANNIIKRVWNQNRMVNIEDLSGMAFQAESGGHTFEISGVDDTGAAVELSGTVAGVFRRPDNADIALTGSASDGVVSVTLSEDCYAVPGRFGLTVFVTSDDQKTAVYAAVGTVAATNGGAVAGDTPQDVVDLINAIEAAVATIPADYTDLMAAIAPTYSNSALYAVGSYAWYAGDLYRCITVITTAETWTAAHWTAAVLGDDVKLAIKGQESVEITDFDYTNCTISASNTVTRSSTKYKSRQVTNNPLWKTIGVTANNTANYSYVVFLTEALPTSPTNGADITSILASGETGRQAIAKGTTQILTIPSDAAIILIAEKSNNIDATPSSVIAYTSMGQDVKDCKDGLASKLDATYPISMNYSDVYGSDDYPLGWQTGYYNGSGEKGSSTEAIITTNGYDYVARTGDTKITFTVPNGVSASIIEYDADGTFVQRIGGWESGVNAQTVTPTVGYKYRFMVSGLTDSSDYLTEAYIATCIALIYKDVIAWQNDQDNRIYILENGKNEIPSYYTIGGYLQGKVDTISAIQNSLGANQDAFLFVTDYHHQYNQGNSLALMSYIARRTGIKKLFFAGDAGGAKGTSAAAVYHRLQMSAQVWDSMTDAVGEMYGVLGNHEWINTGTATIAAVMGSYLNRYKNKVIGMDAATGNYYFDNVANKIRYFFINDTNASYPISGSIPWFGAELANVPDGYSVCVVMHFAYIPNSATLAEYDGYEVTYNYTSIKAVSQLLAAMRDKTSFTFSDTTYDYSSLTGTRHVIGIFSGHIHHGFLYTESTETGIEDIAVFRGMTDGLSGAISVDGMPWYWENGVVGGTKIVREPDTVTEQCFYAVQIDLDAKKLYITAVGGDNDYEGEYEPTEA